MREKVFFVQKLDEGKFETESLWCIKNGDDFILDNIPFIAKRIALGDTIKAEYDNEDKAYYFDDFVAVSGNSTIRIYLEDESMIPTVRDQLKDFNCESEVFLERKILAVNVPSDVIYTPIKAYLENGERAGVWSYEESCLSHQY